MWTQRTHAGPWQEMQQIPGRQHLQQRTALAGRGRAMQQAMDSLQQTRSTCSSLILIYLV